MIGKTVSHYKITRELGAGGMGVVYEAVDTMLDRTVALKFLSPHTIPDFDSKARFIHEAKAASSLDHPNICTIHGIEETEDGRLFIAMTRYEGETLKDLISRGPVDIQEVLEIAIQIAQGLAKAHCLGIVHRDIKPANVFLTEDGLVKLLDFGIAKLAGDSRITRTGEILGTAHYMSPEQLQGEVVDRRTDLWSLGVVLYEMLAGRPPFTGDHQPAVLYGILNTEPEPLVDVRAGVPSELELAVARCLGKKPTDRFRGVEELLLDLRPLADTGPRNTLRERTAGLRSLTDRGKDQPYPGLASFTEKEAENFHGRESKVESVWQKLRHGRLLAVTGPSGVGKTSFLRAGLVPAKPSGWGIILAKPGGTPLLSLREALVPELTEDPEAIQALMRESDLDATVAGVHRWRQRHDEALLILDQFEELYTLSPREDQKQFADLLSRLTFEADLHVLVSLRDDFLVHCHGQEGLAPLFESLTILGPLTGSALRRALVQPALDCGFSFEDETLVDEMMAEVEGERGALPLLAFGMAKLWEGRDREQGLLTRKAYEQMGAVSGALAQHAEAVIVQVGQERIRLVQEIFRNLITPQGTRAVLSRDQLLTVFDEKAQPAAQEVLDLLVDARLLTSYEMKSEDGTAHHRIEVVHESLLSAWPRLVRWQSQDADNAQLRDQVRQAARLWEQRDCSDDLLWTGTAYRDFELWRERYPGGLSSMEASFAQAMKSRSQRRTRRRRLAVTSTFIVLLAVLAVVGVLGNRANKMERFSEARRFYMLAEEKLEQDNTLALALATASLQREDNSKVRRLAQRALWKAPVRSVITVPDTLQGYRTALLSPDGMWLATVNEDGALLWPRDGGKPLTLTAEETAEPYQSRELFFDPNGRYLLTVRIPLNSPSWWINGRLKLSLWSIPEGQLIRTWTNPEDGWCLPFLRRNPLKVYVVKGTHPEPGMKMLRYSLDSDLPEDLGSWCEGTTLEPWIDQGGLHLYYGNGKTLFRASLDSLQTVPHVPIGRHGSQISGVATNEAEDLIASSDMDGEIRVWSRGSRGNYVLDFQRKIGDQGIKIVGFDWSSSRIVYRTTNNKQVASFKPGAPLAQPIRYLPRMFWPGLVSFTPDDNWLVFAWRNVRFGGGKEVFFYSLAKQYPETYSVLPDDPLLTPGNFMPDGSQLVATTKGGGLWLCNVISDKPDCKEIWRNPSGEMRLPRKNPLGRHVLVNGFSDSNAWMIPLDGSEPLLLGETAGGAGGVALDPSGKRAAVSGSETGGNASVEVAIRIYDLETGEIQALEKGGGFGFLGLIFLPDDRLIASGRDGLFLWDLTTGEFEILSERPHFWISSDSEYRFLAADTPEGVTVWDLEDRTERILPIPSPELMALAISPDGQFVVAGMEGGEVYVHLLESEEPYLLLGHDGPVGALWISPESDEIRTAGWDRTVCVWEVPSSLNIHGLSHEDFLAVLRSQTNMRIVTDVDAEEGFRIEYDRFGGWETVPSW